MMKYILILLLVVVSSCGLDSFQEKSLNSAVAKYLFAVNSDLKLSRVAFTHPEILRFYKSKGDEEFKELFKKEDGIWRDAVLGQIEKNDNIIHVQLKVVDTREFETKNSNKRFSIFAISLDSGGSWFFVEEKDYKSKSCGTFKRLIQ